MTNRQGFSLVEITLALGVVAFALIGIFALVSQAQRTSRESRLESAAAILSGQVNSALRAPYAWDPAAIGAFGPTLRNLLGVGQTLSDVAQGKVIRRTNFFDITLQPVTADHPDRQFVLSSELMPVGSASLSISGSGQAASLAILGDAGTTVAVQLEIAHPALAPESMRSKRRFFTLITRSVP